MWTIGTGVHIFTHKFLNFDDMMHKKESLYLATLNSMWYKYTQDLQFLRMWDIPLKQTYKVNVVIYSSETELKIVKNSKQDYHNQIQWKSG